MDLPGACFPEKTHQAPARSATDQRIVDDDDSTSLDELGDRVVLDPNPEVPPCLSRMYERPSDVMIPDERQLERKPGLFAEAEGRGVGRIRHGKHAIGVRRVLPGELPAERPSGAVHAAAPYAGVRACEVDQLEQTRRRRLGDR